MTDVSPSRVNRWIMLHGFTQTHQSWWPVIAALVRRCSADELASPSFVLPDLPGHGLSPTPTDSLEDLGADVAGLIGDEASVLVGYSMGARVALAAAVAAGRSVGSGPGGIRALVLVGATAGIETESLRAERRREDAKRAERIESDGVPAFLDEWVRLDLFGGYSPGDLTYRRRNSTAGLAGSLRRHGTGSQAPLWGVVDTIDVPTLVVAGEHDHKFVEIGRRLEARLGHAEFVTIDDADHAAHLQRPDEFAAITTSWLSALPEATETR